MEGCVIIVNNSEFNMTDFYKGESFNAYEYFGAHLCGDNCVFRLYAPSAARVEVIGEFNGWEGWELKRNINANVFEGEFSGVGQGMMYKYRIYTLNNVCTEHCDPYGRAMELRPGSASIICEDTGFCFTDDWWMSERDVGYDRPVNIYEVHLGSWRRKDDSSWYTYAELGEMLAPYLNDNGYTHVEIMPICEHPVDESWGYQTTGFYSPTSRYGSPNELKQMINHLHSCGIGVILDFVPIHFAVDGYSLSRIDGTELYEYPSDTGVSEGGSYNFKFGRGEVCSFLKSAADYWLREFHFDGLRVDAVSRAIFWLGDPKRGVNGRAIEFISSMNSGLAKRHKGIMLIAEDSTDYLKVTAPSEYDGLGFSYKWDMGWMNDTLSFFKLPPVHRANNIEKLKFSMHYFYNELYMLPLSHDEVVHGKATIIQKMWGDYEVKFPQARLLYLYMYAHPGKKLNFMGNEIAQFREWDEKVQQDWSILKYPLHDAFFRFIRDLCRVYRYNEPLFNGEYNMANFKWHEIDAYGALVFERGYEDGERCLVCMNFIDMPIENCKLEVENCSSLKLLINSDADIYGGSTEMDKSGITILEYSTESSTLLLNLPPFSGQILKIK